MRANLAGWFAHHLAVMLNGNLLPRRPVLDYGASREQLVDQAAWFVLRSMGLKEDVLRQHFRLRTPASVSG